MRTTPLYDAAAMRHVEKVAAETHGLDGYTLMQRAARAALDLCRRHYPDWRCLHVVAGPGNNGGDGIELARQALALGRRVRLVSPVDPTRYAGAAADAWRAWRATGRSIDSGVLDDVRPGDVIVDALFGIGLNRAPAAPWDALVDAINAAPAPCVALDVPSGVDADTGVTTGLSVRAHHTVTFIALKAGLVHSDGRRLAGRLAVADLGIAPSAFAGVGRCADLLDRRPRLRPRARASHKGDHGRVLVIGGAAGTRGAAIMAGMAAQRAGAGLVRVLAPAEGTAPWPDVPAALMVDTFASVAALAPVLDWADTVAIGPGLGTDELAGASLDAVLDARVPVVIDADALTLLARRPRAASGAILTPHPGEAARLLGTDIDEIARDRLGALTRIVDAFAATVVLKGPETVVGAPTSVPAIASGGNPGLATGGSGDVLTGIVAALVASGRPAPEAAALAVTVHNAAADRAAGPAERGLAPDDVLAAVRSCVN